jgi:hypothetical protein
MEKLTQFHVELKTGNVLVDFSEVRLVLQLNVTCGEVTEGTGKTEDSELIELNQK